MRGIEGNFMAQPRVFAHSAQPVTPGNDAISETEERGCALYVGTTGTIVVRMEGTHKAIDASGAEYDTNVNIYYNVPGGSFLPILVTHVLESNLIDLEQRAAYWQSEVDRLTNIGEGLNQKRTDLQDQISQISEEIDNLESDVEKACEDNPGGPSCKILGAQLQSLLKQRDELEEELADVEEQLQDVEKQLAFSEKSLDQVKAAVENPENIISTDAENILALF